MNKNNKLEKNMFKKIGLMTLGTFLLVNSVFTGNAFAGTTTQIEVNGLRVTIDRLLGQNSVQLGENAEFYDLTVDNALVSEALTLNDLRFDFTDTGNYLQVLKSGDNSWTISANYNGLNPSPITVSSATSTCIDINQNGVDDLCVEILGINHIIFGTSEALSNTFFDRILTNHDAFTFSAKSSNQEISVKREKSSGMDKYTFSSVNSELKTASIIDEADRITLIKNVNDSYTVNGQYSGQTGGATFDGYQEISYGNIQVVVEVTDSRNFILSADPSDIERIAQKILNDKKNITEITIENGTPSIIPSGSNIRDINIPANVASPEVQFTVETSGANKVTQINNELTVVSQNASGMQVVFPQDTQITGPNNWNGTIKLPTVLNAPTVSPTTTEGYISTINSVIEIGLGDENISFNNPVTLRFPGMANKEAGFVKNNAFSPIQNCNPDGSFKANECKKNSGNDLVVLTNHFTEFVVYSQTATNTGTGGGPIQNYLTISNVNVNLKNDEASITFNVNRPASIVLKYGLGEGVYTNEIKETQLKTSHSFNLINLKESKYYYKIEARDKEGSSASYSQSFTLSGVPAISEINNAANMETSTKVKDQKTYNYNGVITTKPLNEMSKDELFRLFLILLLKSLLAQKGITL